MNSSAQAPSSLGWKIIRYWVPVLIMLGLMAYFSTDVFSGENTRGAIETILSWFSIHPSKHAIGHINFITRKCAHFVEYAVLATLIFRAFRADSASRWRLTWFFGSLGIVVIWSLLDEYHQSFTRTRGASIYDSLLDSAGGLFALIVITLISRAGRRGGRPAAGQ
jgi:VanZ family protein